MKEPDTPDITKDTPEEIISLRKGGSLWNPKRRGLFEGASAVTASAFLSGCNDEADREVPEETIEALPSSSPFAMVEPIGRGHTHEVTGLVAFQDCLFSCGADGQLLVWDLVENKLLRNLEAKGNWAWQDLAGSGDYIVGVSEYPPKASCWDRGESSLGLPIRKIDLPELDSRIDVGREGLILFLDLKGIIHRVNLSDGAQIPQPWVENGVGETAVTFDISPIKGGAESVAWLARLKNGDYVVRSANLSEPTNVRHMSWLSDEGDDFLLAQHETLDGGFTIIAANRYSGRIHLVGDGGGEKFVPRVDSTIASLATGKTSDGDWIALGYEDGRVLLVNLQGKLLGVFQAHSGAVTTMCSIPDSSRLATGGADRAVRVWELERHDRGPAGDGGGGGETDLTESEYEIEIEIEIEIKIEVRARLAKNYTEKNWEKRHVPQSLADTPSRPNRHREDLEETKKNRTPPKRNSTSSRSSSTSSGSGGRTTITTPRVTRTYHYWRPN